MIRLYILETGQPRLVTDVQEWSTWMAANTRRARFTVVGSFTVSTVFRGFDDQADEAAVPLLFETALLHDDRDDEVQKRYATVQEAIQGHVAVVAILIKQDEDTTRADVVRVYRRHERD